MAKKMFLLFLILNFNMTYSQKLDNSLHKKWLVYNTLNKALNGWVSFTDNYILDFTNNKNLKIKTLGDSKIESVKYSFNSDTGIVYEDNGDILYKVKKISTDQLVLVMGEKSETEVFLTPLVDAVSKIDLISLNNTLKEKKWTNKDDSVEFIDEKYVIKNEIDTNFKIFTETNNKTKKEHRGAWLIDSYENIVFLELFSERTNHKAVYVLKKLNESYLKGDAFNKEGEFLKLELFR